MDEKITSRENAKIKYACRLASGAAFRRTEGRFLAEGRKLCPELARGAELETLFYTENALEKCPELAALPGEHYLVEDHVADKLAHSGGGAPRRAVSGAGTGAGPRQCGHFAAQRSGLWL